MPEQHTPDAYQWEHTANAAGLVARRQVDALVAEGAADDVAPAEQVEVRPAGLLAHERIPLCRLSREGRDGEGGRRCGDRHAGTVPGSRATGSSPGPLTMLSKSRDADVNRNCERSRDRRREVWRKPP